MTGQFSSAWHQILEVARYAVCRPKLLESDVAIGAAFSERVLMFLGAEEPEVPTVFEPEVDRLLGFLAAPITARFFQRADERFLHDGPQRSFPNHVGASSFRFRKHKRFTQNDSRTEHSVRNHRSVSFEPQSAIGRDPQAITTGHACMPGTLAEKSRLERGLYVPTVIKRRSAMNWDTVKGDWKQFSGKVKAQWGKLTDDELTQINGNREQLEGKIQAKYGYAKDKAKKEVDDWFNRIT
jgi:uncharacterized protein YjbJ (UPF0337 family)